MNVTAKVMRPFAFRVDCFFRVLDIRMTTSSLPGTRKIPGGLFSRGSRSVERDGKALPGPGFS
jgi:hypothetical protein